MPRVVRNPSLAGHGIAAKHGTIRATSPKTRARMRSYLSEAERRQVEGWAAARNRAGTPLQTRREDVQHRAAYGPSGGVVTKEMAQRYRRPGRASPSKFVKGWGSVLRDLETMASPIWQVPTRLASGRAPSRAQVGGLAMLVPIRSVAGQRFLHGTTAVYERPSPRAWNPHGALGPGHYMLQAPEGTVAYAMAPRGFLRRPEISRTFTDPRRARAEELWLADRGYKPASASGMWSLQGPEATPIRVTSNLRKAIRQGRIRVGGIERVGNEVRSKPGIYISPPSTESNWATALVYRVKANPVAPNVRMETILPHARLLDLEAPLGPGERAGFLRAARRTDQFKRWQQEIRHWNKEATFEASQVHKSPYYSWSDVAESLRLAKMYRKNVSDVVRPLRENVVRRGDDEGLAMRGADLLDLARWVAPTYQGSQGSRVTTGIPAWQQFWRRQGIHGVGIPSKREVVAYDPSIIAPYLSGQRPVEMTPRLQAQMSPPVREDFLRRAMNQGHAFMPHSWVQAQSRRYYPVTEQEMAWLERVAPELADRLQAQISEQGHIYFLTEALGRMFQEELAKAAGPRRKIVQPESDALYNMLERYVQEPEMQVRRAQSEHPFPQMFSYARVAPKIGRETYMPSQFYPGLKNLDWLMELLAARKHPNVGG